MGYRVEIYADGVFRSLPLTRQGLPSISWRVEGEVPFSVQASEATFDALYEQSGLEIIRRGSWGRVLWDEVPIYYGVLSDELLVSPRQGIISVRLVSPLADMKRVLLGRRFSTEPLYRYRRQETDEGGTELEFIALPMMYEAVFNEVEKLGWEKVYPFSTPRGGFSGFYEQSVGYEVIRQSPPGTFVFRRPLSQPITAPASIESVIQEIAQQIGHELGYQVEADLTGYSPIRHSLRARLLEQAFDDIAFYTYQGQVQMIGMEKSYQDGYQIVGDLTLYTAQTEVDLQQASQTQAITGFDVNRFHDDAQRRVAQASGYNPLSDTDPPLNLTLIDSFIWTGFIDRFTYVSLISALYRYDRPSRSGVGVEWKFRQAFAFAFVWYDHSTASWRHYGDGHIQLGEETDYSTDIYHSVQWQGDRLVLSTDDPVRHISDDPRYLKVRGGDRYIPAFQGSVFLSHMTIDGKNLEAGSVLRDICALSNSVLSIEGVGVDEVLIRIASRDWEGLSTGYTLPEPTSWRYRIADMRFAEAPSLSVGIMENEEINLSLREFYRNQFSRVYYYIEADYMLTQFPLSSIRYFKPLYRWGLPSSIREAIGGSYGMIWEVDIKGDLVNITIRCEQPVRGVRVVD